MQYTHWFRQLDDFLTHHRDLWQLRPFAHRGSPWAADWPALAAWLEALPEPRLLELDADLDALAGALAPFVPAAMEAVRLTRVPRSISAPASVDERLSYRIPGRKWQQVRAFVEALPRQPLPVLEWCAGKGHLGRLAGRVMDAPVISLEIDPVLCEEGKVLAQYSRVDQTLVQADVTAPWGLQWLTPDQQVLALHACGDLHRILLQESGRRRLQSIHISPCCYHRTDEDLYRPLSQAAQSSILQLCRQDRQLAVQETVTAGQRVRRLRETEVEWRLGFDMLQRELRGIDVYLPLPPVQKQRLNESFESFCRWAADYKGLALPDTLDYEHFERLGEIRCAEVRRIELVSHLFRRPLELWLVLDRVLFLEEQGYDVQLVEFCDRTLTPRNLLIQAQLKS